MDIVLIVWHIFTGALERCFFLYFCNDWGKCYALFLYDNALYHYDL